MFYNVGLKLAKINLYLWTGCVSFVCSNTQKRW